MTAPLRRRLRDALWHRGPVVLPLLARAYRRRFGRWPRVWAPRTFNEKLLVRMAFDRRPVLPRLAGKLEARGYVAERLGRGDAQAALLAAILSPADLHGLSLPERCILKASHASGLVRIVTPEDPLAPGELDALVRRWLPVRYGTYNLEWCYRDTRPAVVAEELLQVGGAVPQDYKLFCFDGRAAFIQVDSDRFGGHVQSIFDLGWTRLPVRVKEYDPHPEPPPRPAALPAMIEVAERLAAGLDFVRVDLYDVGGRVMVGELTNYPQGGSGRFFPDEWDAEFGRRWTLPPWRVLRGR